MTYVNKRTRIFLDRGDIRPERRRSEARLKTYPSAIDIRAWCDVVEDRRQHILELVTKGKERCSGRLVPIETIINALLAGRLADIEKLKNCLAQLWEFLKQMSLNDEDRKTLIAMRQKMDSICVGKREDLFKEQKRDSVGIRDEMFKVQTNAECVAAERHRRELEEVEDLTRMSDTQGGTYKITTKGPARVTTRIKGIRPGFQVAGAGVSSGTITTRAQGSAKVKAKVVNAFPDVKVKDPKQLSQTQVPVEEPLATYSHQPLLEAKPFSQPRPDKGPATQGSIQRHTPPSQNQQAIPTSQSQGQRQDQEYDTSGMSSKQSRQGQRQDQPQEYGKPGISPRRSRQGQQQDQPQDSGKSEMSPKQSRPGTSPKQSRQGCPQENQITGECRGMSPKQSRQSERRDYSPRKDAEPSGQSEAPSSQGLPKKQLRLDDSRIQQNSSRKIQPRKLSATGESVPYDKEGNDVSPSSTSESEMKTEEPGDNFVITPDDPTALRLQLEATETLCHELQANLENLKNEKNEIQNKFEKALEELEAVKKLNSVGPIIPSSCKEEIEALELEIKVMRSGNLSPEQEAEVIKKEVDVLKKYCMKLKSVEDENEALRLERDTLKNQAVTTDDRRKRAKDNLNRQVAGISGDREDRKMDRESSKDIVGTISNEESSKSELGSKEDLPHMDELKSKLKQLDEITKERDMLVNKVQKLEKELLQYRDLPENIEIYRNKSKMLDSALEERDKMSKKMEQIKEMEDEMNQLRKKSARVDELEEEVKLFSKNDKNIGSELKKTRSRCTCLQKELDNVKMERDSMRTRIEYMKKEIEMLKSKSIEAEIYKVERDKLQLKVNELTHIQIQYENLRLKCKCLENAATEKEIYKQKYEEVIAMECQGDKLRAQVEAAKCVERERNALIKQVGDLESCICDQEEEIKKLVTQIDNLCRSKDENQCRMKEALANMRKEIEKKDCLIAESEEKLSAVQAQLKSSIQGVSCETTCYKTRIEDLEKELDQANLQIETLKKQLNKNNTCLKDIEKFTRNECETVSSMKRELDEAKAENRKLRDIANRMAAMTGDEHVQNMLKQSQCAVKRVVEELGRQYKEWDNIKRNQKKRVYGKVKCCNQKHIDYRSDSDNEKIVQELEDIQREKEKLEQLVKQIQNDKSSDGPQKELVSLRIDNAKLQEQLQKEEKLRKEFEKKVRIVT